MDGIYVESELEINYRNPLSEPTKRVTRVYLSWTVHTYMTYPADMQVGTELDGDSDIHHFLDKI